MAFDFIDWLFQSATLTFNLIVSNWLLASFLFVQILSIILIVVKSVRNK